MYALIARILLLLTCCIVLAEGIRGGGKFGGGFKSSASKSNGIKAFFGGHNSKSTFGTGRYYGPRYNGYSGAASGLSGWGIIAIIMCIVVGCCIAYYAFVFYPIVCAKRGKYDVMDMSAA